MVSPELLRRYPFFRDLTDAQLKTIAMISEEVEVPEGTHLFSEGHSADHLYLLMNGSVDLTFTSQEEFRPETKRDFPVGEINPGEVFGISAVLAPYVYTATEQTSQPSKVIKIDAVSLRAMMAEDCEAGFTLMNQVCRALMERLTYTRVQLAAAWS